jgi:tetratricopeptide (TPR) repeat protein
MISDNRLLTARRAIKNDNVSCSILAKLGSIEYYDERDFKKAYKIYEKAYNLLVPVDQVTDNNMRSTLVDICIEMGGAAWRLGKYDKARKLGETAVETIKKMSGSVDNYLNYHRNAAYRRKDFAVILALLGRMDEAEAMAKSVVDSLRCSFCRHSACYEAYLSLAKICEFKNDKAGALEYYRKANEIGSDDSEVISAMIAFTGGRN